MNFKFEKTEIEGLLVINPFIAYDERGFYKKYYEKEIFNKNGIPTLYYEASDIFSNKGSMRGIHYQDECSQGKLLHVVTGSIYDVVLDLRENSDTFGEWKDFELSGEEERMIYVPEGCAHGCLALEDKTILSYMCTDKYVPESCGGIIWNDCYLNIPWPLDKIDNMSITEKDKNWPTFKTYCEMRGIRF